MAFLETLLLHCWKRNPQKKCTHSGCRHYTGGCHHQVRNAVQLLLTPPTPASPGVTAVTCLLCVRFSYSGVTAVTYLLCVQFSYSDISFSIDTQTQDKGAPQVGTIITISLYQFCFTCKQCGAGFLGFFRGWKQTADHQWQERLNLQCRGCWQLADN